MGQTDDLQELKSKSLAGIGALVRRQVIIKFIIFVGNVILARILAPEIFGVYAIVSFVVQFFSTFGDVGVGAALIQKRGELNKQELSSTFWLQQVLVWTVVVLAMVAAPLALKIYPSLPERGIWLIRAMSVSMLFSSLKTIPAILMERNLEFNKIAWVDIAENLGFQLVAISLAYAGFEEWSFVIAAVVRGVLGAVIIYLLTTWRPTFEYSYEAIKELVRFGLPYQGNNILGFIKDAVTPLFVGAYAGPAAVGYVNWARTLAFAPLMLSESFSRVSFPAFSKIQHDKELLARAIERSIRNMTLVMFPITAIMIVLGFEITRVIFTDKWLPGIWAFYFYCTSPLAIGITLPMYSAILSLGKSKILLKMTGLLLLLEWGIGIPLVIKYGFLGIAINQPIMTFIFFFIYSFVLRKENVKVKIYKNIKGQLLAAFFSGLAIKLVSQLFNENILTLILQILLGLILFLTILFLINKELISEFKSYLNKVIA